MSRTVPRDARQEWPYKGGRNNGYGDRQDVPGAGQGDMTGASAPEYGSQQYGQSYDGQPYDGRVRDARAYGGQGYPAQDQASQGYGAQGYGAQSYPGGGYGDQGYGHQGYAEQGYDGQGYAPQGYDSRRGGQGHDGQGYDGQGYNGQGYAPQGYDSRHGDQGYAGQSYDGQGYNGQGYNGQGYAGQGYAAQGPGDLDHGYSGQPTRQYEGYNDPRRARGQSHPDQAYTANGFGGPGPDQGYADQATMQQEAFGGQTAPRRGYQAPGGRDRQGFTSSGQRAGGPGAPGGPGQPRARFRRLRSLARRPAVRVIGAIVGIFLVWVMFSAGQAAFKNNGQGVSANLAEWARDHYLGPIVTFGEWLSYNPPKVGGNPAFSYSVPKGEQITVTKGKHKGFVPDIPPTVRSLAAGPPLPGEGQWRVIEKVKGQPAILATFLRDGGQYTSYSNGIASMDQRLIKFSLRPGTEDPGSANWGVPDYIPQGGRTGLLATFNGGFKLDSAQGGFYLNGIYHGTLQNGSASVVYYKNGTIKIGKWGRDFTMSSSIVGVRQNLELLVDHGQVSPNANSSVKTGNWGATLGGGYWVWRSGLGMTKDGRIIYVYGEKLDAQDLAELLKQAGVVEGMQMDINPAWMKFDYYQSNGHPSDPTPMPLLPSQQPSPYSYYTPSTRDFTAVYAR